MAENELQGASGAMNPEYDGPFCTACGNEMVAVEAEGERVSVDPTDTRRVVRTYYGCVPCGKAAQEEY